MLQRNYVDGASSTECVSCFLVACIATFRKGVTMFKTVEDMQKLGKSQIEAATASAAAVSRGLQQIAAETSDFSKKSMEDGSAAVTRLLGTKSLDAVVQVQTDYAKASYASMMAQATKVGEMLTSVGKDAYKPFEGTFSAFTAR